MKIGVCTGTNLERIRIAKETGFDFVEGHCQDIVKTGYEELEKIKNAGIPMLTANCFIGLRVVGDERDEEAIKSYLADLFKKSSYLGIRCLVFGSSGARNIPDNQSYEETYEQIVYFLKNLVAPLAEKYDIPVAIEPLRKAETNIIHTVAEGVQLAEKTGSPYIRVLADVKHVVSSDESLDSLSIYRGMLIHAHTSNPYPPEELGKRRIYPKEGDGFNQDSFFMPLIAAGVETCSIEADVIDFENDCKGSIPVLSKYRG